MGDLVCYLRRTGRPYTLVLVKTNAVFERDATERKLWESELHWLNTTTARAFERRCQALQQVLNRD